MTDNFINNLNTLFDKFSDWPCKAKFKYVAANRFVETIELEDSIKSKYDPHTHYLITRIKLDCTEDNGHILIDFKFDERGKQTKKSISLIATF